MTHDDEQCARVAEHLFAGVYASRTGHDPRPMVPWHCPHAVLYWLGDGDPAGAGYTWTQHWARVSPGGSPAAPPAR